MKLQIGQQFQAARTSAELFLHRGLRPDRGGCAQAPALTLRIGDPGEVLASLPLGTRTVSAEELDAILRNRTVGAERRV